MLGPVHRRLYDQESIICVSTGKNHGMESVTNALEAAVYWVSLAFEAPFARADVFGVHIRGHLFVEGLLFVVILYLLLQKSYKPPKRPLTDKEIDELCDDWTPEPLIPVLPGEMRCEPPQLDSAAGPHTIINGKEVVNFASANYLGLVGHKRLLDSCTSSLEKYGVGSCGPRGFYGTIDVHLDCEARISKFLGTPDSILYSYGLSTNFSAIPAFCKKGDVIVVDEGVHWGIQNGLHLSRSTIVFFKHNDMASLQSTLEKITVEKKQAKEIRRYIVIEAVYQNSGQIAPLDGIIRLKEKYRFRLLMDENNSFGVLGHSGRGLTEYHGVPIEKIDIVTAAMGHALAAGGGFCTGSARFIDHQRLSSSGYVFSASLPPYLASAAISAIDVLEENSNLITKLKENVALIWAGAEKTALFRPFPPHGMSSNSGTHHSSKNGTQSLQPHENARRNARRNGVTSCGHIFCRTRLLDFSSTVGQPSCPTCSKPLTADFTSNSSTGVQKAKTSVNGFRSSSILNRIQLDDFQRSTKIDALREEIRFMVERDGSAKGIVFSQFTSFLDLIMYSLQKSGITCVLLDGSMTIPARDNVIKRFHEDPDCRIFLISLKAGGVALNLTVASHVFLMDPWWNPAAERQAMDRIHRIGQYKPIRIVRFVIENTIEERILKLQEKKELVFEGTVGGSSDALSKLTEADLKFLFVT